MSADARSPSLLARLARSRHPAPRAQDPADMGTAFGMDYMLEQAALPANEATPEAPAEPGWLERWRDRKPDR